MRILILVLAAFAFITPVATPSTRQTNISGEWLLNFNGPQGPVDATGKFTQDGENVTGTIEGPQGSVNCSGTLKETKLALSLTIDANGQSMTVYLVGEVSGDSIKGTFSMADMSGEWGGKRKN